MTFRQRFTVIGLLGFAAVSTPLPAARPLSRLTPSPDDRLMAAGQGAPEAACASTCAASFAREMSRATQNFKTGAYFEAVGESRCPGTDPKRDWCAAPFWECTAKCGLYDDACKRPCHQTLQACCYLGDAALVGQHRDLCVAACPKATPAAPIDVFSSLNKPGMASKLDLIPYGTDAEAAWEAREALKPPAERETDDLRRQAVFRLAAAELNRMKGKFVIVSGGGGRLWVVRADGSSAKIPAGLAGLLRSVPDDEAETARAMAGLMAAGGGMGFSRQDAAKIVETARLWKTSMLSDFGTGFAPGEALYFPEGERWPAQMNRATGSSEHSSIRGTINGGGDFI